MKIDIGIWTNMHRMRERIRNLGTMVLSICAVNGFYMMSQKSWVLLGINILFFLSVLPIFVSHAKWQKEPPKQEIK